MTLQQAFYLKTLVRNICVSILFVMFHTLLFAQSDDLRVPEKEDAKHFIAAGYGKGNVNWFSKLADTKLYDKNGTVIKSGNLSFKSRNPISSFFFDVSFPVAKMRLGVGISFESFYLDKLQIKNPAGTGSNLILFDEKFRLDKIYTLVEVPLNIQLHPRFSFDFRGQLGYFGYNAVERENFFGEETLGKTFYTTIGMIGDYRVLSNVYIYLLPNIEYKFFKNSRSESPSIINHNIVSESILLGLRIDLSGERD